jgi:hypothetical protein
LDSRDLNAAGAVAQSARNQRGSTQAGENDAVETGEFRRLQIADEVIE